MALKFTKKPTPAAVKTGVTVQQTESGKVIGEETHNDAPEDLAAIKAALPDSAEIPAGKPWCTVGYSAGYTHNLGNYQSARVDVWVTIPCPHGEIDDVYTTAEEWVDERISKAMEAFTQG